MVVDPFDQPLKVYPEFGVAVMLTWVPCEKVPPVDETLPPSPAETLNVYCYTIWGGGALVPCESSFAQVININKIR